MSEDRWINRQRQNRMLEHAKRKRVSRATAEGSLCRVTAAHGISAFRMPSATHTQRRSPGTIIEYSSHLARKRHRSVRCTFGPHKYMGTSSVSCTQEQTGSGSRQAATKPTGCTGHCAKETPSGSVIGGNDMATLRGLQVSAAGRA